MSELLEDGPELANPAADLLGPDGGESELEPLAPEVRRNSDRAA